MFLDNENIKSIFEELTGLSKHSNEEVRLSSLTILVNLSDHLKDCPNALVRDPLNIMTTYVKMFRENLSNATDKECTEKIIIVIMDFVMAIQKRDVIEELKSHLLDLYYEYSQRRVHDQAIILEQIMTVLHTCILALYQFQTPMTDIDKIARLIETHVRSQGVEVEGLNLISAAVSAYKYEFRHHLEKFWTYIIHGLEQVDQKPIFEAAIACVSDCTRVMKDQYADKVQLVFDKLIAFMHQPINRDTKSKILKSFGDLFLGAKNYGSASLPPVMDICSKCFDAVYSYSGKH